MATQNKAYVSAINLMDERVINPKIFDIHNEEGLTDLMGIMGRYQKTDMAEYNNFVNTELRTQGDTTGATVTGSGTPTVTTTLTAATSGYARKGDLVKFPNGMNGYVTNVTTASNQDTLTIKSVNGANLTHTAAQKLDFFSSAVGEASSTPANRNYGKVSYSNQVQLLRETNIITDVQKVSLITVEGPNGEKKWNAIALNEKFIKFKSDINGSLFAGTKSNTKFSDASPSLTDPVGGGPVQTTRGFDEYVTTYGVNDAVTAAGTFALADLEDLISQLLAKKAPSAFIGLCGTKVRMKLDNCFKALGSASIQSAKMNIDGREVDLVVDTVNYGGFSFDFKTLPLLNSTNMFSQTDIVKSLYCIPKDNVQTLDNGSQPRIQIRYMDHGITANNKGNAIWAEWHTGAAAPAGLGATGETADWRTHWQTSQGLEVLGAQHFAKTVVL